MSGKTALLIVDFQNDFCEGGALPVAGGRALAEPINELIAAQKWDLVIATKDWHPEGHISFASAHPHAKPFDSYELRDDRGETFKTLLWPDHCIDGTPGAELVGDLNATELDDVVYKGQRIDVEFYSAFADVFGRNPTDLDDILKKKAIKNVVVVGLALDFCVLYTALDAAKRGYHTTVDLNCTRAVSPEGRPQAITRLQEAGVIVQK